MTWSSMRGRPRDLPVDRTPLRGARIDTRARVAWLLRVSRMASPQGGTGAEFSRRLKEAGLPVGASALSRREHGQEDISGAMITAYEEALGLPEGHLRGVCESLRRTWGVHVAERSTVLTRAQVAATLRHLDAQIERGDVTGADWLELSRILVGPGGAVLPPSLLGAWTRRLMREMLRSVGGAYIARVEALAGLMADPVTRRSVSDAVLELIEDPGAGCLVDTVTILGETNDDDVIRPLITIFTERTGPARIGAARALLQQIVVGALSLEQIAAVERAIVRVVEEDPDDGGDAAFILAQRISLRMTQLVVTRLGRHPGDRAPGAHIQSPALLDRYLSAAAHWSGVHGDEMLERLLREALTEDFLERQHQASMMLMVSPYRRILADTALDILENEQDPSARDGARSLLGYLVVPDHRKRLMSMLRRPDMELQSTALHALAHTGGVPVDLDLTPYLHNDTLSRDALYAAGMSAHPALCVVMNSDDFPPSLKEGARWWLDLGPIIREGERAGDQEGARVVVHGASTAALAVKPTRPRITLARPAGDAR